MYQIINQIIGYTSSSQYASTYDQYCWAAAVGLILILTVITCDWLRQLFKSLVNKIR